MDDDADDADDAVFCLDKIHGWAKRSIKQAIVALNNMFDGNNDIFTLPVSLS